jgi:hypothetical protein
MIFVHSKLDEYSFKTICIQCQQRFTQSRNTNLIQKDYGTGGRDIFKLQVFHYALMVLFILLLIATPSSAKILKTMKQALQSQEQSITLGSGLEYQTDDEGLELGFPFLLEYAFTDRFKLTVEPGCIYFHKKVGAAIGGFSEMETSLTYDFVAERRYRPGLSAEGIIKWPIESHAELGTGKRDYSLGIIASMAFVHADMDVNVLYTYVGSPPGVNLQNTIEASLSAEWRFSPIIDLEGEVATVSGAGGRFRGHPGTLGGFGHRAGSVGAAEEGQNEYEATLGIAEHLNESMKLEQGLIVQLDGSWQVVFAWEWELGGGD